MAKKARTGNSNNGANLGFEATLWAAAHEMGIYVGDLTP